MKKVGIIGCGAIGTLIVQAIEKKLVECDEVILYDYNRGLPEALKKSVHIPTTIAKNVDELVSLKPQVIVEAASQQAASEYARRILAAKIDLIVLSVGALLDLGVRDGRLHVPSGAVGGLDAISSASLAGINEVLLTTRKNPKVLDRNVRSRKLVFEGNAEEAVKLFPKEMNVAATLALVAGSEKVRVRVVADPKVEKNVHEIEVRWKHGSMSFKFCNDPHPENPKTSALAAWSAIRLLKDILEKPV